MIIGIGQMEEFMFGGYPLFFPKFLNISGIQYSNISEAFGLREASTCGNQRYMFQIIQLCV